MRNPTLPVFLLLAALGVPACVPDGDRAVERLQRAGEIVVLTREAPTTYYTDNDSVDGFEYALTQELARGLGIEVRYKVYSSVGELLEALERGEGDIAAAGLARGESGERGLLVGPDYYIVHPEVVCRRDEPAPRSVGDLESRSILVLEDGNAERHLAQLKREHPDLNWFASSAHSYERIFEKVWEGAADCVVADSNVVSLLQPHYPELRVAFRLDGEQRLAWLVRPDGHDLRAYLEAWLPERERDRRLPALRDRYFEGTASFDFVDIKVFVARIESRLPKFREMFVEAGEKHGVDWTLLAAQAYQESHWNYRAKSPTGVRGVMMLTLPTARRMGVTSRLDPAQSIMGGARYMATLLDGLPETIEPADRIWFALAAYNVGPGHVADARLLTERGRRDPNTWHDVQRFLPLLSQREHYRDLEYGHARGSEPVTYVQRIRSYHAILRKRLGV